MNDDFIFDNITHELVYLREALRTLIQLNFYPDIRISTYDSFETQFVGELIMSDGHIFRAERCVDKFLLKNEDSLFERVEDDILREIGFMYLKRSFEKRQKEDLPKSSNHMYTIKAIKKYLEDVDADIRTDFEKRLDRFYVRENNDR